jgi:hypothetical protein
MENFDLYKQVSAFLEKDIKNWSYINTIEVLLNVAEGFQNENGLMAEKAAEKEIAFGEFMEIIGKQKQELALYKLQETKLLAQLELKDHELKNLKRSTRFRVLEENLSLAQENDRLKELVKRVQQMP